MSNYNLCHKGASVIYETLFKTAITQDVWIFPLQFRYELNYTYWAQLGFTKGTSYTYDNSTTNKRTAINTPATDQNQCRRTSIYERSVISGSYSGGKREAHYTFLQHLMQIITIQRFYRDDANVA